MVLFMSAGTTGNCVYVLFKMFMVISPYMNQDIQLI